MSKLEITNMVMVTDPTNGKVLTINRRISWCGYAFPGGHTEENESIRDSAIREIREETGLEIRNPILCGYIYWYNNETGDKYFTYMYKTSEFSGEINGGTDEGEIQWMTVDEFLSSKLAPNMENYMKFFTGEYHEAFCSWNEHEPRNIIFA